MKGNEDVTNEAAWAGEIQRRIDDLDSGRVKTIPWEEARRLILGEVRDHDKDSGLDKLWES